MHITQHDDGKRGEFIVQDGDTHVGELSYVWTDAATLTIHHTGVIDAYKGQGIATNCCMPPWPLPAKRTAKSCPFVLMSRPCLKKTKAWAMCGTFENNIEHTKVTSKTKICATSVVRIPLQKSA